VATVLNAWKSVSEFAANSVLAKAGTATRATATMIAINLVAHTIFLILDLLVIIRYLTDRIPAAGIARIFTLSGSAIIGEFAIFSLG
jgi:hypothetical protein